MPLTAILAILNLALPEVANIIVAIKGKDSGAAAVILDQADAQFDANIKLVQDWMAAHGKKPVV
jgi:hypothetical protein